MVKAVKFLYRKTKIFSYFAIFFIFFVLYGCHRSGKDIPMVKSAGMPGRLQQIFETTKNVCFGRFLIQVPVTAIVVYGPTEVSTSIVYVEGDGDQIEKYVLSRSAEIERERKFLEKQNILELPLFGKLIDGVRTGQKILIGSKDQVSYAIRSYIPIGSDLFVQTLETVMPDENPIDDINKVAKVLIKRNPEDIPSEPGMCIEGGFVPGVYEYERAAIGIRLKEFPDVHLSIDAHKNLKYLNEGSDPRLLHKRAREIAEAEGLGGVFSRVRILREQNRQLAIWRGQEMAFRTPAYKRATSVHEFRFHSVGSVNDPFHPQLDIRLDSGVKNDSRAGTEPSITDEEALAIWDRVVSTIRLRQSSDSTVPTVKALKPPAGSVLTTGDICPSTGWWECIEKRRVDGDRRRIIKEGEQMPAVLIVGGTGLLRSIIGDSYRIASVEWRLLEDRVINLDSSHTSNEVTRAETSGTGDKHA